MARCQLVPVQYAGDQIIIGNENQLSDGNNNVGSGAIALATATARQTQFRMGAAHPVNKKHDLAGIGIDIRDHFADHRADAFLAGRQWSGLTTQRSRSSARAASDGDDISKPGIDAASCSAIFTSTSATLRSARFQRVSSSAATKRLAGSAASYWRKARSAA